MRSVLHSQQAEHFLASASLFRYLVGGFAVKCTRRDVRAPVEQQGDHLRVRVVLSGKMERRLAIVVRCCDIGASVEEQREDLRV